MNVKQENNKLHVGNESAQGLFWGHGEMCMKFEQWQYVRVMERWITKGL